MSKGRRYRLLCPIARALDHVGDRWALLILRDLHAGPARFSDLVGSLKGIASNMLTDRLDQLQQDGLVEKRDAEFGVSLYALTALGLKTREVLFELSRLGSEFAPDDDIRDTDSLRSAAVTLAAALNRAGPAEVTGVAAMYVDGQAMEIRVENGQASVQMKTADNPDIRLETSYEAILDVSSGAITTETYLAEHVRIEILKRGRENALIRLIGRGLAHIAAPL